MKTKKNDISREKTLLIEAILEHEKKHRRGIYGMKYCQLCGKTQSYSGMYGAMAANSAPLFRCTACKSGLGNRMLENWFRGSVQDCVAARRYVHCQFCGVKIRGTEDYVTKELRDQGYLCPSCRRDVADRISRGEPQYLIRQLQQKRLWLEWHDLDFLRAKVRSQRAFDIEAKRRQVQLRLVNSCVGKEVKSD